MSRVLVFSDDHLPAVVDGRVEFLKDLYKSWKCDTVIHVGDFIDFHAISAHTTEADARGALDEMDEAIEKAQEFYKAFPKLTMIMGNHDLRIIRSANEAKLPKNWLKPFGEVIGAPKGWNIVNHPVLLEDVLYDHDFRKSGMTAHRAKALKEGINVVGGHLHAHAGIAYIANTHSLVWGMNVGCGIDVEAYHMRYGKGFNDKPIIGAGIVIDGKYPYFEPMDLGTKRELRL